MTSPPRGDAPPGYLPEDARAWWPALVGELEARGALERVAVHRLAIYCQLFAQWHRLTSLINESPDGQIIARQNSEGAVIGWDVHPAARHQVALTTALRRFDREFGFLDPLDDSDPLGSLRQKLVARLGGGAAARN